MKWKHLSILLLIYVSVELVSLLSLYLIKQQLDVSYYPVNTLSLNHSRTLQNWVTQSSNYLRHDPELGWTIRSNGQESLYHAESAGIRSDTEILINKTSQTRIACFGDSFTHGDQVSNIETWPAVSHSLAPNQSLEFLNFGVSGYGIDQSFLRYDKLGKRYKADIALIGFMSKDLYETQNRLRSVQLRNTGMPFGKPRFLREGNVNQALRLLPNPLPDLIAYEALIQNPEVELTRIGQEDFYYEHGYKKTFFSILPSVRLVSVLKASYYEKVQRFGGIKDGIYNSESEHFQLSAAILKEFAISAKQNGTKPIVLFLPNKQDIIRDQSGMPTSYTPLKNQLIENNIDTLDAVEAFRSSNILVSKLINGHYTAAGNRQIAIWLVDQLMTGKPSKHKQMHTRSNELN